MLVSRKFQELEDKSGSGSDTEVGPDGIMSVKAYARKRAKAGAATAIGLASLPALKEFVASLKDTVHGSYWITEPSVRMTGRAANVVLKTVKLNDMDEPEEMEFREKIFPSASFEVSARYALPYFMGPSIPFRLLYNQRQKKNIARIRLDLVLAGSIDPNRRLSQRKAWEEYLSEFARLPAKEARKVAKPKLEPSSSLYRSFFQSPLCEIQCLGLVLDLAGLAQADAKADAKG